MKEDRTTSSVMWVVIATIIGTLPAVAFLRSAISYSHHADYALDPDADIAVGVGWLFVIASAHVSCIIALIVAHFYRKRR